jgi:hypothetical protein
MMPSRGANSTLYESPPVISRRMHPSVPGFGGSTVSGETLPLPLTLIWKVPLDDFLICAALIGPFSYFESLYLNPFTGSPVQ